MPERCRKWFHFPCSVMICDEFDAALRQVAGANMRFIKIGVGSKTTGRDDDVGIAELEQVVCVVQTGFENR